MIHHSKAISRAFVLFSVLLCVSAPAAAQPAPVKAWEQNVTLPTYLVGDPDPNPMFYFGRASQGAEGRVYPYPLYDTLTHKKVDRAYRMVYLENEYIRIGILPEIGGRVFEGLDKTNGYHFFYRQHVIKPALIGLIGAWISGGIEWNIPHHHRASTFLPVQYRIESNADGSKTVWVGELEVRHRMRWAVGYTVRPGKAYLEASVRIVNRTPVVNTMLCFANVAVHANENYQVIFPPGTQYGTHHHKREFTGWPIATGRYGGATFNNVDVSWFKNHDSSNSIFAWNYEDNFLAGYDHGKQAGTMAVANHHVVPGKKLWTWGTGARGRMWDKILSDEDGPYIELMVGAYSDNQPDYSWLQPYEVKSFEMFWYPFRNIGGAKNATLEAAVNLEVSAGRTATLGFHTTSAYPAADVLLKAGSRTLLKETVSINPGKPFTRGIPLPAGVEETDLRASLSAGGTELVAYQPVTLQPEPMPKAVEAPLAPAEIGTVEELYLTGLRIEQFHNPTLDPEPYWDEALRRDPGDARVNTAYGINLLKKARYQDAEKMLRKALERLTANYTTPKDGEPMYYLGLTLKAQGKEKEAFDILYRATWSMAWRAAAYFELAEMATSRNALIEALDLTERSLEANSLNIRALTLKAALLRHLGREAEAGEVLALASRRSDPLDVRILAERWLLARTTPTASAMTAVLSQHPATAAETAAEYMNAGLWKDGSAVLLQATGAASKGSKVSPLLYYYLAYFATKTGDGGKAKEYLASARQASPDYAFPFQNEMIPVLREAIRLQPDDARAPYYLGNLLLDSQPEEAVRLWEASTALDGTFAVALRNLAVAYSHQKGSAPAEKAIALLERAVQQQRKYPTHLSELDQLYEAAGADPARRLALLEQHHALAEQRDEALAREITLKVFAGKYDEAIRLMTGRRFSVWEGGNLDVASDWTDAHMLRGRVRLAAGSASDALADFRTATEIPDNLPSERLGAGRTVEAAYWIGCAYDSLGDEARARESWTAAAAPSTRRGPRTAGEGAPATGSAAQDYWRVLAMRKLGDEEGAGSVLQQMVKDGAVAVERAGSRPDFFNSFGEQQSQRERLADAHFQIALGCVGLGDKARAGEELRQVLRIRPDHTAAKVMADELNR